MSEDQKFNQEQVNKIVEKRLAREKQKTQKELEKVRQEITESKENDDKARYFNLLAQTKLLDQGIKYDDLGTYMKFFESKEDEKEIEELAKLFGDSKRDEATKQKSYADPNQKQNKGVWNPFK